MSSRALGALVGAALGAIVGTGTGIVGGFFGGVLGFWIFVGLGGLWGLSAGQD